MPRKLSEEKITEIKELFAKDISVKEISRRLGISVSTAWIYTRGVELGYKSFGDYVGKKSIEKGHKGSTDYRNYLARKKGHLSYSDYNIKLARREDYIRVKQELDEWAQEKGFASYVNYSEKLGGLNPEKRMLSSLVQMRLEREEKSIEWLANELGVSKSTTSRYYHGTRLPGKRVQKRLFKTFDLPYRTIDDFFEQ